MKGFEIKLAPYTHDFTDRIRDPQTGEIRELQQSERVSPHQELPRWLLASMIAKQELDYVELLPIAMRIKQQTDAALIVLSDSEYEAVKKRMSAVAKEAFTIREAEMMMRILEARQVDLQPAKDA